jgi:O-methyltransferase
MIGRKKKRTTTEAIDGVAARVVKLEKRIQDLDLPVSRLDRAAKRVEDAVGWRYNPLDRAFISVADELVGSARTLLGHDRLNVLWQAARNTAHLGLPAVEVGVYRGGSSAFLAQAFAAAGAPGLRIFAVDTFQGHPDELITEFDPHHRSGLFADTSFEDVREFLSAYDGVEVRRGAFPAAAADLPAGEFSLAHLDTDLYGPTLESLRFFTAHMPAGGVMVVDDYGADKAGGVLKAVHEFLDEGNPVQRWDFGTEQAVLVRRTD